MAVVNTNFPELAETRSPSLPAASLESLKLMREQQCSRSSQEFKLQPVQRFLRRVLSPDSPTRNLLMVHGTGTGKTCSAIQIAEEYIIRPEFQDKKVLVIANPPIQANFKREIFDVSRVDPKGEILSQQCTGRRYLEMLERTSDHTLRMTDAASRRRMADKASRIISEFYEFIGYESFANLVTENTSANGGSAWIHETFDNRLIIVDEAHNLRDVTETTATKKVGKAMETVLQTATGVTLVMLTATPLYDRYDEIVYYFNLFLWNEKKIPPTKTLKPSDFFTEKGDFKEGRDQEFRRLCQDYVSYIKGENPFTFPFRLPPPDDIIAEIDRETDVNGKKIVTPRKYLKLTKSYVHSNQEKALKAMTSSSSLRTEELPIICVYPENKTFRETFEKVGDQVAYKEGVPAFLAPSKVALYSSKFSLIMRIIEESPGIVFVYSNLVTSGAQLFALCLEEHGYESALGKNQLSNSSEEVKRGSKGKYVLFTSEISSQADMSRAIDRLKSPSNADGSDIKIIVASPVVSEGVDFKYIRQIHVLDPWYNMARIEQALGRAMRTCSHSLLPFEEQNCTVYLHVCRYPKGKQETFDEYIYREFVEHKAINISKVKRVIMESAMDCDLQNSINSLPEDWLNQTVPQKRVQDGKELKLSLQSMFAPTFSDSMSTIQCKLTESDQDGTHVRPLSAILDVRDELFDKLITLFTKKPIWKLSDLVKQSSLRNYSPDVVLYLIQNAIETPLRLKDGYLESKGDYVAYATGKDQTMIDRILKKQEPKEIDVPVFKVYDQEEVETPKLESKREQLPEYIRKRFSVDLQDWYIVDAVLSEKEKIKYLSTTNWDQPYSEPLKAGNIYILGLNTIYDETFKSIVPVGEQLDTYKEWRDKLREKFIQNKSSVFASMKNGKLIFNFDDKSKEIKPVSRSKTIGGMACESYHEEPLNNFTKWLDGEGFPPEATVKKDRCVWLHFLVREAVKAKKQGIYWLTPEEYAVLNEKGNKEVRESLK
uniref:Helicase ATP-binding domain-containing protein n=1 Tax=viral metagenome TaxID=1070528 RepID=A0A6C0CHZ8_9ZZZZ